ncbi:O-antigen ligase family protein [Clostridium boliviensis]|uniref:O-antigen ligase family protein n=1 Tax=Clostridium boliviensis TaxID=318465 RepID=A0ABU4GPW9_9CLOT|nr:O-antigen ligase family protein [Clostridium boliviensis]MDW2799686.1 O-antigen ligase family protein [Clostridium boliviensis]
MKELNDEIHNVEEKSTFIHILLSAYMVLIGAGLPLVVRNKYFDILVDKYYYYCFLTITLSVLLLGYFIVHIKEKTYVKVFQRLTKTDYFLFAFLIIAGLSTVTSDYVFESFWGNEGRLTGFFLMLWYVVSFFLISKLSRFNKWYIDIIIISGIIVSIFGITDYFKLDIFGFKAPMVDSQKDIFTSTIGNINTYTAYVGMIAAITTVLFSSVQQKKKLIFYYLGMVITFFALIMGTSDNAYLSLGALFAFLPLYLFNNNVGIKRYIAILATFFTVIQIIGLLNRYFGEYVLSIDSFFQLLIGLKGGVGITIGLWLIVVFWHIIEKYKNIGTIDFGKVPQRLWALFLLLCFLIIVYIIFDCNFKGNAGRYGSMASFFVFNDDWGTHRGYIWRNAIECYWHLSPWKKLVGYGPETFGILILQKTANNPYQELFDSAHNEYLHLLTTVGIAGLICYLGFIVNVIKRGINIGRKNAYVMAALYGILCYSIQAIVNLNLPIVTPIFWLLAGISASYYKDK